jgi:hypothetical protein
MVDVLQLVGGLFIMAVGLVPAGLPRPTADASEILDAVGSKTPPSEVEAAEWKVKLMRAMGVAIIGIGLLFVVAALGG